MKKLKVIAKYLPIKGAIKKGDIVTDLDIKAKVIKVKENMCEVKDIENENIFQIPKDTLIRLNFFAVTYEGIKNGDPVVIASAKQTFLKTVQTVVNEGYYLTDGKSEQAEFYESKYVFKVLGEIPKSCFWVSEEEEIEIQQDKHDIAVACPHCSTLIY